MLNFTDRREEEVKALKRPNVHYRFRRNQKLEYVYYKKQKDGNKYGFNIVALQKFPVAKIKPSLHCT